MAAPRKPVTFTGNSPLAPLMAQFIQEKRACGYRYDEWRVEPAATSTPICAAKACSKSSCRGP
jgi:hypothetical protein